MEEKKMTRDETAMHNFEVIKRMRDEGMSPAVIHAVFQKEGIDITLEFVECMCKPGVFESLSANRVPKSR